MIIFLLTCFLPHEGLGLDTPTKGKLPVDQPFVLREPRFVLSHRGKFMCRLLQLIWTKWEARTAFITTARSLRSNRVQRRICSPNKQRCHQYEFLVEKEPAWMIPLLPTGRDKKSRNMAFPNSMGKEMCLTSNCGLIKLKYTLIKT